MGYKANIASNLINQVIRIAVGLATSIVVARVLGPDGQGYAAYAILVFTLIGSYGHFGLNNAGMYFQKRGSFPRDTVFNVNLTALFLTFAVIALASLSLWRAGLLLGGYPSFFLIAGLVFVISDFVFNQHHSWYIGDERIIESNRFNLSVFFAKSAAVILLWLTKTLTVYSFFGLQALSMLANALYLDLRLGMKFRPRLDLALLKAEYRFGGIIWLGAVFAFLHYRADQFMIKLFLGTADLGIYTVAVNIAELMFLIPLSVSTALSGRLYNTQEHAAGRDLMARTLKLSLYICALLAVLGIPASLLVPFVYGQAFAGAVPSTMILLAGVVFASVAKVTAPYFYTLGKPVFHLIITFATLLLNIALNWMLIPVYGIAGAALASSLSYFAYGLYYLLLFVHTEAYPLRQLLSLRRGDVIALWSGTLER
jgi:O-antigen/teichoic acid export membrane protein